MANLSGLGAFAQGLAGGIQQGTQNYMKGIELAQERKKSAMQEEHLKLSNDIQLFKEIYPTIKKSTNPETAMNLANEAGNKFYSPFFKNALIAGATASKETKKAIDDAATRISELISNPSRDAFARADLEVAKLEADEYLGVNHPVVIGLKSQIATTKANHKIDDIQNLVEQIDAGMTITKQIEQTLKSPVGGLIPKKPNLTNEQLQAVNVAQAAKNRLLVEYPDTYKIKADEYGWKKPGKQIERTIDLGDKQRVIYTDGTEEDIQKGVSPNTQVRINMGDQRGDARFAMNLRKEFNAIQPVKDYRDITTKYNIMNEAFKESKTTKNFVAVDQALITLYNKMTDPQSVVRESEYVRTPEDMAIMDRAKAAIIRVGKGGRLEANSRQAIMTMAGKFKKAYEQKYNEIANEYRGYAGSSGVNPDDVVKPLKEEKQKTRNISKAVSYLKTAKDRNDAKNKMKALMQQGWEEEELREIEKEAGY